MAFPCHPFSCLSNVPPHPLMMLAFRAPPALPGAPPPQLLPRFDPLRLTDGASPCGFPWCTAHPPTSPHCLPSAHGQAAARFVGRPALPPVGCLCMLACCEVGWTSPAASPARHSTCFVPCPAGFLPDSQPCQPIHVCMCIPPCPEFLLSHLTPAAAACPRPFAHAAHQPHHTTRSCLIPSLETL